MSHDNLYPIGGIDYPRTLQEFYECFSTEKACIDYLWRFRWPKGAQDTIILPPHLNCRMGENDIVATFHTHPNIGGDYLQEPGETDKRAVRDDPDLKGTAYVGEFVISQATIHLIMPDGQVYEMGNTRKLFSG